MNKEIIAGISLFAVLIVSSFVPNSEAELWELVVDLEMEKTSFISGETVRISGVVVDHSYQPVRGAEVLIRAGAETTKAFTNPQGVFLAKFTDFERVPGTYTINVVVTSEERTGLSSMEFKVLGITSPILILQEKLSTDEARKYIASNPEDFKHNPIGLILSKYYHGLLDELIEEQKKERIKVKEQVMMNEQKALVEELKQKEIEEWNPRFGLYEGYQYEIYMNSLDPKIRDTIDIQLNFTKNIFLEAQKIKNEILANGGSYEEARKAYLEKISISKETLEEFNKIDEESK